MNGHICCTNMHNITYANLTPISKHASNLKISLWRSPWHRISLLCHCIIRILKYQMVSARNYESNRERTKPCYTTCPFSVVFDCNHWFYYQQFYGRVFSFAMCSAIPKIVGWLSRRLHLIALWHILFCPLSLSYLGSSSNLCCVFAVCILRRQNGYTVADSIPTHRSQTTQPLSTTSSLCSNLCLQSKAKDFHVRLGYPSGT